MATSNMMIPDLGGAENVEVIEICVAVGDVVSEGDSIIVVETDKASMEIPASSAGVIKTIVLKEGDTCSLGDVMVEIETAAAPDEARELAPHVEIEMESAIVEAVIPDVMAEAVAVESERLALVPDLGGAADVEVIEISVKVGDELAEGDSLIVLETDKASMEIPVTFAGTVLEIKVAEGAKINVGDTIAVLTSKASKVALETLVSQVPQIKETVAPSKAPAPVNQAHEEMEVIIGSAAHAGPAVRMLARELGVELAQVAATGPRDRVLKEDIEAFVKQKLQQPASSSTQGHGIEQPPAIDFSQFGAIDRIKMSKVQRITAQNMTRSWLNV
ncbi:MAG: pyruvate dehydrogenase E2 component (dihydrolipoamide acetyltransferase), partial [Oceanospirillaceae bacterium]